MTPTPTGEGPAGAGPRPRRDIHNAHYRTLKLGGGRRFRKSLRGIGSAAFAQREECEVSRRDEVALAVEAVRRATAADD